jgi:VIT1/CCC1 family predicted Fe2+/Mn2+ transporter
MSSVNLSDFAYLSAVDEYTDYLVYKKLSGLGFEKRHRFSGTLKRLAAMEHGQYRFWSKYCPERKVAVSNVRVYFILLIRLILGVTFAVKFLERNEMSTIRKYKDVAWQIPQKDRAQFNKMIADEVEHENMFAEQFDEPHIKYISFIVLGLANALVEIAGIHAGSLGIYNKTELAGLAGIIAGVAAWIAMASAAYSQAKTGFKGVGDSLSSLHRHIVLHYGGYPSYAVLSNKCNGECIDRVIGFRYHSDSIHKFLRIGNLRRRVQERFHRDYEHHARRHRCVIPDRPWAGDWNYPIHLLRWNKAHKQIAYVC